MNTNSVKSDCLWFELVTKPALFVQPNQSLQPTAGRHDNLRFLMQHLSILVKLGLTSGG